MLLNESNHIWQADSFISDVLRKTYIVGWCHEITCLAAYPLSYPAYLQFFTKIAFCNICKQYELKSFMFYILNLLQKMVQYPAR